MASFPSAVKTFTTKNTGDTIQAADVNDLQTEVNAIEDGYVNGTARLNSSASTLASLSVPGGSTLTTLELSGGSTIRGDMLIASTQVTISQNLTVGAVFNASGQLQSVGSLYYKGSTTIAPGSTGNTNDLAISSAVSQVRLNISGDSTITGLAMANGATDGQTLMFWNVGAGSVAFPHQTGSASSGQWLCPQDASVTLKKNGGLLAKYDATSSGWRIMLAS